MVPPAVENAVLLFVTDEELISSTPPVAAYTPYIAALTIAELVTVK